MDVQQLFKRLKKEAECPLCLDTVKNPKTLPCLHSFCLECLDKLANFARRQLQTTIKCPVCQTSFPIPDKDTFANLPTSFHLNRLVDVLALEESGSQPQKCNSCDENNPATSYCFVCQTFMCASCFQSHQRFKATRGHRNVLIDKLQAQDVQELIGRPVMCSQEFHEDQPLEFYCEDCKALICLKCSVVSHNRHLVTDTQKAALEQKMQMTEAVAKLKAEILLYENEIKKQTELKDKNTSDIKNAEKKMTDSVEEWIRNLREHEKKMKDKFREIYEAEQKQHKTRLENLELITTKLKCCLERGQGVLQRNISSEILQTNQTIQGCDELINARKPDRYKSPYLNYLVKKKFDIVDQIIVTKTDSSMCLAEFDDSEIGRESNFVVVTRDSEGLQCYQLDDQIKVDILTPEGDHLKTELKDSKDGKYTVRYTPQCAGQHSVEIQVNGQPLTGSPFLVQIRQHCYQFAFKFGLEENRAEPFPLISDIAVSDRTGAIAVADFGNKRIQLFNSDGKFQMQVELDEQPYSAAFTDCGDLLLLVSGNNNKLRLFSGEGQFIKHINDKHLKEPQHVSIASDGGLIITDHASNEVKVLSHDGNEQLVSMTAPNCDKYPDCAVHHQNKFYVSYPWDHCIKVFDKTGVYIKDIGCGGSNDGQFNYPVGLVIDKYNQLIVCDVNNQRLQLFTLSGKFLRKLQGGCLKNNRPRYAALNNDGNLIVAGRYGYCIFVNS
ncbi:PREDICTED: E3 ubiquitin-protein ligase TRIM71-like [Acropora digitifera]|uniref:E3 ubiquitin-protein ligase TRIM71-like n=1 Tax=Acropora digitifera TaxID=70779 RepID=UPI00077AAC6F|nr:PREDICTED: E3 ubiquitin-protein ligase TRIM71-like [Acropora digitifera]XP_015762188.1 PREDICTED: E3 ubiquitin-protein ligase TRIM71-like [Acropora digitifera]